MQTMGLRPIWGCATSAATPHLRLCLIWGGAKSRSMPNMGRRDTAAPNQGQRQSCASVCPGAVSILCCCQIYESLDSEMKKIEGQ
jgi:hypothetical protein